MKYKLTDAAKKLGVHKQTTWNYIKSGQIKASKTKNNRWYIAQYEIN